MVDGIPTGTVAFEIFSYTVANGQQSFRSKIARRLTRKLGSNISRQTLLEFGAINFTERFLTEIFQFNDERSAWIENEALNAMNALKIYPVTLWQTNSNRFDQKSPGV
jgi:hypothetical protein